MDDKTFGKPPVPGTEGAGGEKFDESLRFPGTFYAKNITPAALGDWTDGEIIRAIASGVSYNFYRSTGRRRPALV